MPFKVVKSGKSYVVKKRDGSKTFGRHTSRSKAFAQIKAIQMSEKRRKK